MAEFLSLYVSAPFAFKDGLIVGNPDSFAEFEGDIPDSFDLAAVTIERGAKGERLVVILTNTQFELAFANVKQSPEAVTPMRAPSGAFTGATVQYTAIAQADLHQIFVRKIEDSNT